ncbi:hypothetical protein, partial [Paraburkholderia sediminicola]|uniref:hypothetical protein n=1 Tax=Paraburkholderia sediminicola TaxID=458836 RepID=UPI0038BCEBC9
MGDALSALAERMGPPECNQAVLAGFNLLSKADKRYALRMVGPQLYAAALAIDDREAMGDALSMLEKHGYPAQRNLDMLAGFDLLPEPGPEADPEADKSHALKMAGPQLFAAALAIDDL